MPEIIQAIPFTPGTCPVCKGKLRVGKPMVLQQEDTNRKYPILPVFCELCRIPFANETALRRFQQENNGAKARVFQVGPGMKPADIRAHMRRNPNMQSAIQVTCRAPGRAVSLGDYCTAAIELKVSFQGGKPETCLILSGREKISPQDAGNVFYYNSPEGLELLTAAYVSSRKKRGTLQNADFEVISYRAPGETGGTFRARCMPKVLYLGSNGGYYHAASSDGNQIVDLLLYTWRTDRLQILKATYTAWDSSYYTDARLFREFAQKYGIPDVT